jgi:hypothetical protein
MIGRAVEPSPAADDTRDLASRNDEAAAVV